MLSFRGRLGLRLRPLTHTVLQPRFMMTAAMAFFSIALTLNVAGIHLNQIHASDLRPSSLRRDFYQANAHVVRYYDNLRVVYELESRVRDLQRSTDENSASPAYPAQPAAPDKNAAPQGGAPDGKQPAPSGGRGAGAPHSGPRSDSSRRDWSAAQPALVASTRDFSDFLLDPAATDRMLSPDDARRMQSGRAL